MTREEAILQTALVQLMCYGAVAVTQIIEEAHRNASWLAEHEAHSARLAEQHRALVEEHHRLCGHQLIEHEA
jgi:hypothetical protein